MNRFLLAGLMLAGLLPAFGQKNFQEGYYIDNAGNRFSGQIRVPGFGAVNNTGATLRITNGDGQNAHEIPLSDVKEIVLGSDIKLRKFSVMLDDTNYYTLENRDKYPEYKAATVFLNTLVEGTSSLLAFESSNGPKFFYLKDNAAQPQQLIFKKYIEGNLIRENVGFRKQLFDNFRCLDESFSAFSKLEYTREALIVFFEKYNNCGGTGIEKKGNTFHNESRAKYGAFTIYAGMADIQGTMSAKGLEPAKSSAAGFNFGAEGCFRKASGHFAGVIRFEIETARGNVSGNEGITRGYAYRFSTTSVNFALGGRYYMTPLKPSGLFLGASLGYSLASNLSSYEINYYNQNGSLTGSFRDIFNNRPAAFASFSAGYQLTRKIGAELVYDTQKKILKDKMDTGYAKIGVALRYSLL